MTEQEELAALREENEKLKTKNKNLRSKYKTVMTEIGKLRVENTVLCAGPLAHTLQRVTELPENTVKPGFEIEPVKKQ